MKLPRFLGKSQKERPFLPHFLLQFGLASASASEDHSSCVAVKARLGLEPQDHLGTARDATAMFSQAFVEFPAK